MIKKVFWFHKKEDQKQDKYSTFFNAFISIIGFGWLVMLLFDNFQPDKRLGY